MLAVHDRIRGNERADGLQLIYSTSGQKYFEARGTSSAWTDQSITALVAWRKEEWMKEVVGSGIAQLVDLGALYCVMQSLGFDPPLRRIFPVEGIFPLEFTWVLTPLAPPPPPPSPPTKTLLDETINRGLVCAHMFLIVSVDPSLTVSADPPQIVRP